MIANHAIAISTFFEPVSKALIHSLWQGGLIASMLAITLAYIKPSSARLRYALSYGVMALIVVMTGFTGLHYMQEGKTPAALIQSEPGQPAISNNESIEAASPGTTNAASLDITTTGSRWDPRSLLQWFFPCWLVGIMLLSLRNLVAWRRAKALVRRGTNEIGLEWSHRVARLCQKLEISKPVRFVGSSLIHVPCVIGWLKPVVLIPLSTLAGLDVAELEMILAHELAHIRRYDVLFNYLQTIIETLFFFNPAIWWISRQIRIERENCCDDLAAISSGNRLSYARALTNLEAMRNPKAGFEVAAGGSPLIPRIRRLVGISARSHRSSSAWAACALILAIIMALSLGSVGVSTSNATTPGTSLVTEENFEPNNDDIRGEWEIRPDDGRISLKLQFGRRGTSQFTIRPGDFSSEIDKSTTSFQMSRDAGTFHFEGEFEPYRGSLRGEGDCYFRANPEYMDEMGRLGFRISSSRKMLSLALLNVTLDYAKGIIDAGYDDLSLDELTKAHIHDVTPMYIDELDALGYHDLRMGQLVKMQIHDVEPEYIRELADLGYDNLSVARLLEMQIHDVDPDDIRELAKLGYTDLDASDLIEMQIHDVDPDYIHKLDELGYSNLGASTLKKMRIHDVDPYYISQFRELGYDHIDTDELIKMRIHDVEPSFVRKLARLGYKDVKTFKLIKLNIHDVTTRYISDLAELGYDEFTLTELIRMRIHDVTASFVRRLHKRGLEDLTSDELVELKIHGRR
jgi:beta-lactamase regulating signal transducer with metallopeptidase domain